jgi:hypothetical protein
MKRIYLALALVGAIGLVGCGKSSDDSPKKSGNSDIAHKPSECPAGIEGTYAPSEGDVKITVSKKDGDYLINDQQGFSVVVNGTSQKIQDGGSVTGTCSQGSIYLRGTDADGGKVSIVMQPSVNGLSIKYLDEKDKLLGQDEYERIQ